MKRFLFVIVFGALLSLGFDMTYIPRYYMRVANPGLTTKTWLQDATKRGNDLTAHNGAAQISGNPGNAVQLVRASSQYLDIVSTPDLSPGGIFTIAVWIYPDSLPFTQDVLSKYQNAGQREFLLEIDNAANATFLISPDGTIAHSINSLFGFVTSGQWHFIVASYDGTKTNIVVDAGHVFSSSAYSSGVFQGTDSFVIGSSGNPLTRFFDGRIDGIGMWKGRALSFAEISQLYNGGAGLPFVNFTASLKNGLTAYYDFENQFENYLPLIQVSDLEFEEVISVPGQHNNGHFTARLYDTRDEAWSHLRDSYNRLKKEQRVEIYDRDDFLGHPKYTGVITATPGDLGRQEISGENMMRRLDARKLMPDENIADNARSVLQRLTKTYQPVFFDDFGRTAIGSKWTVASGTWDIVNGTLRQSMADGTSKAIASFRGWDAPTWMNSKISVDIKFSSNPGADILYVEWNGGNGFFYISASAYLSGITQISTNAVGADFLISTDYKFVLDSWNHIDIILKPDVGISSHYTATIYINGVRVLSSGFHMVGQASDLTTVELHSVLGAGGAPMYFDNFVFAPLASSLTPGAIDYTADNFSETIQGETQQQVIERICNRQNWQYRLVPRAGAGNTWLDAGANIGNDYSDLIKLREGDGQNGTIISLSPDQPITKLANWLTVKGQSQDTANSNYITTKLSAFIDYGIVESEYQDERIIDVATAKLLSDNQLDIMSQGIFSFTGRVLDESWIIEQVALWQQIHWGNFIWGGLGQGELRAGDYVKLEVPSQNINSVEQIVSIKRQSGSAAIDLVFASFTDTLTAEIKRLRTELNYLRRSFTNRQAGGWSEIIQLAAGVNYDWLVYFHGQVRSVLIDLRSGNWLGGAMTVSIDGVDRTLALFGSATIGGDKYATDTLYMAASGNHTVTFNCNQNVLLSAKVEPRTVS